MKHYVTKYLFFLTLGSGALYGLSSMPGAVQPTESQWIGIGALVIAASALLAICKDDNDKGCGTAA